MKYYKLILDNTIIGAITSNHFIQYQPITGCFLLSNEEDGEYIDYKGIIYRATWMKPATAQLSFTTVQAVEITEEQYQIYEEAIDNNKPIEDDEPEVEPTPVVPYIDPNDITSLEFIRTSKLNELSNTCHKRIEAGFNWGDKHYSLTKEDQINLLNAQLMINSGETSVLYHADGEDYRYFNAEEILVLVERATNWRLDHTIYLKSLKQRVNAATTIEEIAAITYEK